MNNNIGKAEIEELKNKYQGKEFDEAIEKVNNGYPIQYLIGNVDFYGNKIIVNENVLIPRYETEFLVDLVIKTLGDNYAGKILDVGSGSGCIAISIAKTLNKSTVDSIDISAKAIEVANENKKANNIENVNFIVQDIFEFQNINKYEVIISNPPYVSQDEAVGKETKYEPQNAIFADDKGLIFYKEIINQLSDDTLVHDIFFEIGMNQAENIRKIVEDKNIECKFKVFKDLSGKDRYIHIVMNK